MYYSNINGREYNIKNARKEELEDLMFKGENQQTETLNDQQLVEFVEKAIRDNPNDFPLLTKYYLNAE